MKIASTNTLQRRNVVHVQSREDFEKGNEMFFSWKHVKVLPSLAADFASFLDTDNQGRCNVTVLKSCVRFKRVTK